QLAFRPTTPTTCATPFPYTTRFRSLRAVVTKPEEDEDPATWCFALIGQRARQLSRPTALRIIRSRWHIENTAFHQWTRYWNLRRSEEHTSELQSHLNLVCRLLLEKE